MPNNEIRAIEQQIRQLMEKLARLQKTHHGGEVNNYNFSTLNGKTTLMGGCRGVQQSELLT